jgi:pyruvate dehydrogenase E1 component alpha subunit
MLLIREFEATLDPLSMSGKIPGGLHLSIGQEAVAVGITAALEPQDLVACAHRSHHHALAKGMAPRAVMAELFGKATGCRGGRGGSMHLADLSIGFLGGNGIVGAGLGIAMGASLASSMRGEDQVSVGIFGDGGANTGRTWETVNIASVWKLPLIIVCENNMYAVETETERLTGGGSVSRRAEGFGLPVHTVDGQDVAEMYRVTREARQRAAAGGGPTFIEAKTYRYEGHSTGQVINYRTIDEVEDWRGTKDPIQRLRIALHGAGALDDDTFEDFVRAARDTVQDAIAFAEESPLPDAIEATRDVTAVDLGLGNAP